MPKVSVIIPVYGVEKYIERCARSLFEQTLDDIEYIFVDDCSPDKSMEILNDVLIEYPHRRDNVIIHRMEKNSGQAKVREWGMRNATGDFVIHCDSDDWADLSMYEKLYLNAKGSGADIVFCNYNIYYNQNNCVKRDRNIPMCEKMDLIGKILSGYYGVNALWAALIKRDIIGHIIYPTGNQGEDSVIIIQSIFYSHKISVLKEYLYYYYCNPNSINHTTDVGRVVHKVEDGKRNVKTIEQFLIDNQLLLKYKKKIIAYKHNIRMQIWSFTSKSQYRKYFLKTFPEINREILFNRYIPLRSKVQFLITLFGLKKDKEATKC